MDCRSITPNILPAGAVQRKEAVRYGVNGGGLIYNRKEAGRRIHNVIPSVC